jgi:hypothetical protein
MSSSPRKIRWGRKRDLLSHEISKTAHLSSNPDGDKDSQPGDVAKDRRNLEMGSLKGYE